MDYIAFCKNYYAVTKIPVYLISYDGPVYSTLAEQLHLSLNSPVKIWPAEHNPEFRGISSEIIYGSVYIENTDYFIMIGPCFSIPITDEIIRQYMHDSATPLKKEDVAEILASIPRMTSAQFCQHLVFLHQCLNNKTITVSEIISQKMPLEQIQKEQHLKVINENLENEYLHNTYQFELELYQHIQKGNINALKDFLATNTYNLKEGKLAQTQLRHMKNLFIGSAFKIGMLAAIPGGVDIEKTYQLIDLYIQECEQLHSIEKIQALRYSMLLDFCQRAGETKIPKGISKEVFESMNYIRTHTNMPISVDDVAWNIERSSSYIMKKFKEELGFTIGSFITRCKLEEAKSLLTYSNRTLADISNYLCFSSQPHFQSLFKKQYKMTPLEYRKKSQKENYIPH